MIRHILINQDTPNLDPSQGAYLDRNTTVQDAMLKNSSSVVTG